MKTKLYLIILAGFFSCFTMAQSPAGEAFLIDINAFNSDGLARFMNCGNGDSLGLGDEFTIELWMRLDDYVGNQKILGKTNGNFNSGYIVGLQNAKPYVEVFTPTNMELVDGIGGASIPLFNYWCHMAITYNPGDSIVGYVNGRWSNSRSLPSLTAAANTNDFVLGVAPWDMVSFQSFGQLDEVRVWSKALTHDEVKATMHTQLTGSEDRLVGYWTFDGATASSISDESGNGATGVAQNPTGNDFPDSRAVLGSSTMSSMNNITGVWNGSINPINTDYGLSIDKGNFATTTIDSTDYSVFGHDGESGTSTSNLPADAPTGAIRTAREWYFTTVGWPSADIYANLADAAGSGAALNDSKPATQYGLLRRTTSTGTFTLERIASTVTSGIVIFDNVQMKNGYYSVAVADADWISTGMNEANALVSSMFPNPANDMFYITVNDQAALTIINALGQTVKTQQISYGSNEVSIANLASGNYSITVIDGERMQTQKLIVE